MIPTRCTKHVLTVYSMVIVIMGLVRETPVTKIWLLALWILIVGLIWSFAETRAWDIVHLCWYFLVLWNTVTAFLVWSWCTEFDVADYLRLYRTAITLLYAKDLLCLHISWRSFVSYLQEVTAEDEDEDAAPVPQVFFHGIRLTSSSVQEIDMSENPVACPICLDPCASEVCVKCLQCHVVFHRKCLVTWWFHHRTCPHCRMDHQ